MDPALEEMIPGPPDDLLEAMIRLRGLGRMPKGFRPVSRFGDVVTGRLRRGDIARVWADPEVVSLKAPRLLDFTEGPAGPLPPLPSSEARRPPVPEIGRGAVVGVIDWGLDVTCPAFRSPSGATRVLALWDQRDLPGRPALNPFGYGCIMDRAAINAALALDDPHRSLGYHPADADPGDGTHGTHVLDIAAGNGRHGGPMGMAPGADCVFVHLAAGALGGLANLGDSLRICEALAFIRQVAGPRPFVVNMSVGRHASPHTGTTLLERAIDALVEAKPGRAVVMSTGNYYQANAHASGRLIPGRSDTVTWNVAAADPTINELEVWYPDCDTFHVRLEGPESGLLVEAGLDETAEIRARGEIVGRLYHRAFDPNTRDHHVNLFLYPGAPVGAWRMTLLPRRIRDGRWHAWVERDTACRACQSRFDRREADPTHTTGSICNGFLSIAVGALDTTGTTPHVARFSSSGPTRDGRAKPDCVAPGAAILAARSASITEPTPLLTRKSGASQAAPFVAGTIALVFEAARRPLTIHETRTVLLGTATPMPGADPLRVGAGAIDPCRAVTAARTLARAVPGPAASLRLV